VSHSKGNYLISSSKWSIKSLLLSWLVINSWVALVHRSIYNAGPQYLSSLQLLYTPLHQLRSAFLNLLVQPRINIALAFLGFRHAGPSLWYSLPLHLRSTYSYTVFKSNLKTHLFSGASFSGPWQFISTRFWFDIIMLILRLEIILCYVMLRYVINHNMQVTSFCSHSELLGGYTQSFRSLLHKTFLIFLHRTTHTSSLPSISALLSSIISCSDASRECSSQNDFMSSLVTWSRASLVTWLIPMTSDESETVT